MEFNKINLENNKEYIVIDTIENIMGKYLILGSIIDNNDICIRKVITKEDNEYIIKLESNEEFEDVMTSFNEKYDRKDGKFEE